jgi:NAD(P)-dependent dehydrogenase (short-subunit alcohol dehydrogenase family)
MTDARPLQGKNVLVSGGSRNLGEAVVRRMASLGASLTINHWQDGDTAEELGRDLAAEGYEVLVAEANVSDSSDVKTLVAKSVQAIGTIDVLIHCAGPFSMTPFSEMAEHEWDTILGVNLKAAYLLARELAPGMKQRGWGRIILMSAGSAFIRTHSIYGLAKSSIIHLTESLAVQLGPEITVNAIAPGQILESAAIMDSYEPGFSDKAIQNAPLKRLVTRSEVAEMMALICTSPAMQSVTGHTFVMDGGWRLTS